MPNLITVNSKQTISVFRPPLYGVVYCLLLAGSCAALRQNNAKLWGGVFFGITLVFWGKNENQAIEKCQT